MVGRTGDFDSQTKEGSMIGTTVVRLLAVGALALAVALPADAKVKCKHACKTELQGCKTDFKTAKTACKSLTGSTKKDCKKAAKQAFGSCKTGFISACSAAGDGTCPSPGSSSGAFAFLD